MDSSAFGAVDRIILGRRVISMQPDMNAGAEGVAIRGDRIVQLVTRAGMAEISGPDTEVIDTGDRILMPGFVDVHAHAEVVCRTAYGTVDCRAPECGSVADVQDVLSAAAADQEPGSWVVGQGNLFFDRKLAEGRLPSREELDQVSRTHPVAVRAGGHITVLNSRALEVAGIDRNYEPPSYSVTGLPEVERDKSGEPTGVVKEMDTLLPFPAIEGDDLRQALKQGLRRHFTNHGVTTIGEISETVAGVECMGALAQAGELPASMRIYLWAPGTLNVDEACKWPDHIALEADEADVRIQGVKLFADGGFSARSAAVSCPYLGAGDGCGSIAFADYFLQRAFRKTREAGLQLAIHANGDRAQEWICRQIIEMGGSPGGRIRTRIEHAGNLMPNRDTARWWAEAGIIPVPQPVFLYTFGEYFPDYLGEFGKRGRFAFKQLIEDGWRLSGSSDVWIGSEREATNPFFSIWCCLKRQTFAGAVIDPEQALSIDQALRLHTLDAAATMGEEDIKGSLAPGKHADVIAIDRDPREVDVDEIRHLKTELVVSRGRIVHSLLD